MITSKKLVEFALKLLDMKAVYWYGTFYLKCTTSLYNSKKSQYPGHYTSARASTYKQHISAGRMCVDCIGVIKGAAWSDCGAHTAKYATNGCPDKSADGMFSWCKTKGMKTGKIGTLPEVPGLFLHMSGHAGVYIGNGYAIEAKGFASGVVKSKVAGRGWTGWAYLPFVDYSAGAVAPELPYTYGSRTLQKGDEGDDVKQLQTNLIDLGYSCGKYGTDGELGQDTEKAVVAFQYDHGLPETGVVDEAVFAAIAKALCPDEDDAPDEPGDTGDDGQQADETVKYVTVTSGNTVNVRTAPTTTAAKLGIAYRDESFEYAGETAENGWHKIVFGSGTGWITDLYTTLAGEPVAVPEELLPEPTPEIKNPVIIDVSQHSALKNSKNDWAKIAKNVALLILRCGVTRTETAPIGIGIDAEFAYAAKKCQEHGIPFGVYYYGKVKTTAEARKEAQKAYATASPYNPLFYVYDVEESRLTNAIVEAWMDEIRKLGAKKVGLYIAHHMYNTFKNAAKKADFVWIPRYGKNTGKYDSKYKPSYPCDLHQYTSVGKVAGFADNTLDLSRLTGTKPFSWFLAR